MHATAAENKLETLVSALGIETGYTDVFGNAHVMSDVARDSILTSFGAIPNDPQRMLNDLYFQPERRLLEPVYVLTQSEIAEAVYAHVQYDDLNTPHEWCLLLENGETQQGQCVPSELTNLGWPVDGTARLKLGFLPTDTPWGYHRLTFKNTATGRTDCARFVVTPSQCYLPDSLSNGKKLWGPAVQLYSLRSEKNWGMGDLSDLLDVIDWCKSNQGHVIGLNPLHQLFPSNVHHISPYSPSSQTAFNVWYCRPESFSNYADAKSVQEKLESPEWRGRLGQYRDTDLVDYVGVLSAKMNIFKSLYASFRSIHLEKDTEQASEFRDYCGQAATPIHHVALFEAIQQHFYAKDESVYGWPKWPQEYHNPYSDAVRVFSETHRSEIDFYLYLQWQTELQLKAVKEKCKAAGLEIGLYLDLSVGVDSSGAQVWANQELYALNARVGCPPDALNQKGQDWGLPPIVPQRLREQGYELFSLMLQENMKYAGALRLDHVMGLYRLFWIPSELDATHGTYVKYPFMDLVKLIALESHRNQCVVIGEDLGTIVPAVREAMQGWNMLSYKVLYFEKDAPDIFTPAAEYNPVALVTAGTHDLPTLQGYWQEKDIEIRTNLHLYPSEEMRELQIQERQVDKQALLNLLHAEGLLSDEQRTSQSLTPEVLAAIHAFLARSKSCLQLVQIEDLIGQSEQMNVPGTTNEHPNWRQKLSKYIDEWDSETFKLVLDAVRANRH